MNRMIYLSKRNVRWLMFLIFLLTGCSALQGGSPEWVKSVNDLCLTVDQSVTGAPADFKAPIAEELQSIFAHMGINTTLGEGADCQATLAMQVTIRPVAAPVSGAGNCYLSGNTSMLGQATLSAPGKSTLRVSLNKPYQKPTGVRVVSSCPKKPEDAPLQSTWAKSLSKILSKWWGTQGLAAMLNSEQYPIRLEAVETLASMKQAAVPAIPDLILAIDDENVWVSDGAIQALGTIGPDAKAAAPKIIEMLSESYQSTRARWALMKITGQNFGSDQAAWNQWWEGQK